MRSTRAGRPISEASIGTIEAALTNARPTDALTALNALKTDAPDLVEANKDRIAWLLAQAEAPKK